MRAEFFRSLSALVDAAADPGSEPAVEDTLRHCLGEMRELRALAEDRVWWTAAEEALPPAVRQARILE